MINPAQTSLVSLVARVAASTQRLAPLVDSASPAELPPSSWRALDALRSRRGVRMTRLSELCAVGVPAIVAIVRRLESAGFARTSADPDDARATLVYVTASGTAALARWYAAVGVQLSSAFGDLSPIERRALNAAAAIIDERVLRR